MWLDREMLDSTLRYDYAWGAVNFRPDEPKDALMASDADLANEFFQVKRHGDIAVIVPSPQVEHLPETLLQPAAQMVLAPLKEDPPNQIIVDLADVGYFGSAFITFLLRCHLMVKNRGSELVLAGVNKEIRELLRTTALDTLWALYDSVNEAVAALGGVD
jgi:anti-anti-sigma factor